MCNFGFSVKSDTSDSLSSLFFKERLERIALAPLLAESQEQFALGVFTKRATRAFSRAIPFFVLVIKGKKHSKKNKFEANH